MALFGKLDHTHEAPKLGSFWGQLLVIPEATLLLALLIIGWAFSFPPAISILVVLVIAGFVVRWSLLLIGAKQLRRGAYRRADKWTNAALRLNPWSVDALQLRAEGFAMQGDDATAETLLRRASTLAPKQHIVHMTLSATLLAQGNTAEAGQLLEQVQDENGWLRQRPAPSVVQQRAWHALHIDGEASRARTMLETAEPQRLPAPIAAALLVTLADAQLAQHDNVAAQATVQALLDRLPLCTQPQQAELHYHLGRLQAVLGGDAQAHFRRSVALDPHGRCAHIAWRGAIGQ